MQIIHIHNTETEEIVGTIYPKFNVNFDVLDDLVRKSFTEFHLDSKFDGDYSIEDFVDYHNNHYPNQEIDWCVSDFIQLDSDRIEMLKD